MKVYNYKDGVRRAVVRVEHHIDFNWLVWTAANLIDGVVDAGDEDVVEQVEEAAAELTRRDVERRLRSNLALDGEGWIDFQDERISLAAETWDGHFDYNEEIVPLLVARLKTLFPEFKEPT
jgi:hypothetical protein